VLFNSLAFFIFFPLVTWLYFLLPHRSRTAMLLVASCVFYMFFIPKYILILALTIVVDYIAGILIERENGYRRKILLGLSIVANVGVLALFKYFNFFNESVAFLSALFGWSYPIHIISIILPVGLSFHTFQAMSYTIEVYKGRQSAERDFGIYALYVMFFPQLVAGPIERPQNLLHQFCEVHYFESGRVTAGLRLMAWGLFKKVVVADRLAIFVNAIYSDPSQASGPVLALATFFFAFQILFDFSGYSDIAIGCARVMGFKLMTNFDTPYQSLSISEFWRRWHISLSTWFKDYLYIPLGGSRVSHPRWYLNIFIVFLVSGLWHGANWTYVIWGGMHGFFLVFGLATVGVRGRIARTTSIEKHPKFHRLLKMMTTFLLVCLSWIFFRANSVHDAMEVYSHLLSDWGTLFQIKRLKEAFHVIELSSLAVGILLIVFVEAVHTVQRRCSLQAWMNTQPWWLRWSIYYAGTAALFFFFVDESDQFIYFQF
jgi:alginate O-acetyltransferase complex protein AlgI